MKTFQDGDPLFGVMMNAIANLWPNGTAVLSGCTQTGSGAARQITVAAGTVVIGGTVRPVSQQTKTLDAATFDRYDLLSVNSSGTVVVTKGTEERRVPALPANSVPVAVCLIETGQTTLPADRIYDARMLASRLVAAAIRCSTEVSGATLQSQTGNIGALSQFVDVPGTTVRKDVNISESVSGTWKTLYTITVPPTYSSIPMSSNLRASITNAAPGVAGYSPVLNVQVLRDGEVIGTSSIGGDAISVTASVDTTGGFCAGNTLVIQGSWSDNVTNAVTITNVKIMSNRSTITPATKVFVEAGSW